MKRALLLLSVAACDDALDQRLAIVDAARVLAVIAEPAEAKPGTQVAYRAVIAGPDGELAIDPAWAFCTSPKPPTEDNAVSAACVAGQALVELGSGPTAMGTLPADGCLRFGPDVPPGGFRPRDPDPTGGYYQPVRLETELAPLSFGMSRITCKLGSSSAEVARRYDVEYRANANPILAASVPDRVAANSDVELVARWPADSAEAYLAFDAARQDLVDRREAMRVSWFATAGAFPVDASAVGENERATSVTTTWRAPSAGVITMWVVLRDSRGGTAVQRFSIAIQ